MDKLNHTKITIIMHTRIFLWAFPVESNWFKKKIKNKNQKKNIKKKNEVFKKKRKKKKKANYD